MTTTQAGPAFCTSCGAARREGTGFCAGCGTAFLTNAPRAFRSGTDPVARRNDHGPGSGPPSWPSGPTSGPPSGPTSGSPSWASGPHARPVRPEPLPPSPPPTWIAPVAAPRPAPDDRAWYARPATAVVAAIVAVLAVVGASLAIMGAGSTPASTSRDPANTVDVADAIRSPTAPNTASPNVPSSPVATDPQSQLQALADGDSVTVEGFVGSWIPQLSSKRPGLVADGRTWDQAAILDETQGLRSSYPDARLLWTGDFANYRGRNFWATVVGEPSPSAVGANAWCDAHALDADHCYAVRLTHTGGPDGNAVLRPRGSG